MTDFVPVSTDLLAGRVNMLCSAAATVADASLGGQLCAIAVTYGRAFGSLPWHAHRRRSGGVPGCASEGWYGLYVPAG